MRRLFILGFIVLSVYLVINASDTRYLTLDVKQLTESYKRFADGDKVNRDYVDELIKTSEEIIRSDRRYTIVDKKADTPSGDKHDYISMGPYWWPNPDTPDGLPYIRKDGEVNPESREDYTDQAVISETNKAVFNLAMTYFFTKDDKYVVKASEILRTFYVDEKTRMNPNLNYAQFVPGMNEGRCFGIIESSSLLKMMEAVSLMSDSPQWSSDLHNNLVYWISSYQDWLINSKNGKEERNTKNNHGTHYDVQCVSMYLFCGRTSEALKYLKQYTLPRLASQIQPDGSQPLELARTKSWDYATMNLNGFIDLAILSEKAGLDLWNYGKNGQVYIKSMIDWFLPYLKKEKEWQWKQIKQTSVMRIKRPLEYAAGVYECLNYLELANNLNSINEKIKF